MITNFNNRNIFFSILLFAFLGFVFIACSSTNSKNISNSKTKKMNPTLESYKLIDTTEWKRAALNLFINGAENEQLGNYAGAILEYMEALEYDTSATIYWAIGKNYFNLKKFNQAKKYLTASIDLDPKLEEAYLTLANCYLWEFDSDETIKVYEKLIKVKPKREYKLSLAYLYENIDPEKAIKVYEDILTNSNDIISLRRLNELYYKLNRNDKFISLSEKMFNLDSGNIKSAVSIILAYIETGNYDKVPPIIERFDNKLPATELSKFYLEVCYRLSGDTSAKSNNLISYCISKIDNRFYYDSQLQFSTGILATKIKDSTKAEKSFQRALVLGDTIPEFSLQLATFYMSHKEYQKSIQILQQYQPKFPKNFNFYFYNGLNYFYLAKYDSAKYQYQKALDIEPKAYMVWTQLGSLYEKFGEYSSSDSAYQKALAIQPDDPTANNNYAYSLSVRGINLETALKHIDAALTLEPENASFQDTYGWIKFKLGDTDEALKYIKKASENEEIGTEVYEHLTEIYIHKGNFDEARITISKGLAKEPDNKVLNLFLKEISK